MALRFLFKLPIGGSQGLSANAQTSGDDVIVTISAGDEPFLLDWDENPGAAIELDLADSPYTLTGRDVWTNLTLTETGGDGETVALGSFDTTVALDASANDSTWHLVVTITAGDGPFNITGTGPGLPMNGVAAGVHDLGRGAFTGVTVTETAGDEESTNLGNFDTTYVAQVLDTANLIQFLRLDETTGTAANDSSAENNDGSYQNDVTLNAATAPDGSPAPALDGSNDYIDIYSAGLNADFNGNEVTVIVWMKIVGSDWTDGAIHNIVLIQVNGSNFIQIVKQTTNGRLEFNHNAQGNNKQRVVNSLSSTDWMCLALTCSRSSDFVKVFINGVQQGATITGLTQDWSGSLGSTTCRLSGIGASFPFEGNLALWQLYARALSDAELLALGVM